MNDKKLISTIVELFKENSIDGVLHKNTWLDVAQKIVKLKTGNLELIESIQDVLCSKLKLNKTKIHSRYPNKEISTKHFSYGGNTVCTKIRDYLYKNSHFYLKRKFNKFQSINKI